MNRTDARLERLLGGPHLAALRQRLRRYLERSRESNRDYILHLGKLEPIEREALALLTGRPTGTARSIRINLANIDAALRAAGLSHALRDALGARCAPLVCADGMPATQRTLLDQLSTAGARLHYHGDFDWPGLRIANHVLRRWQAQPWRMAARDYETAVQTAPHRPRDLETSNVAANRDAQLAPAMHRHGWAIAEEAVADDLMEDLRLNTS